MIRRIITYIEQEPWDEAIVRHERNLNRFIFCVMVAAVLYFAPFVISVITK
jgi:hypothetical protein